MAPASKTKEQDDPLLCADAAWARSSLWEVNTGEDALAVACPLNCAMQVARRFCRSNSAAVHLIDLRGHGRSSGVGVLHLCEG